MYVAYRSPACICEIWSPQSQFTAPPAERRVLKSETLRYQAGTNLVLLDPDVRKAFRSERAVNDALRLVIELRKVGSCKRRDYSSRGG